MKPINYKLINELASRGHSIRAISRITGHDQKTVAKHIVKRLPTTKEKK